jgi:ribosomal protein L44E
MDARRLDVHYRQARQHERYRPARPDALIADDAGVSTARSAKKRPKRSPKVEIRFQCSLCAKSLGLPSPRSSHRLELTLVEPRNARDARRLLARPSWTSSMMACEPSQKSAALPAAEGWNRTLVPDSAV